MGAVDDGFDHSPKGIDSLVQNSRYKPDTLRDWDGVSFAFKLPGPEDKLYWQGKQILDVGSGRKEKDAGRSFPGAKVYAIDPELVEGGRLVMETATGRQIKNTAHETRAGVAQAIPFDDDKFDLVISSHAVPQHVFPVDKPRSVSEMIRVMKPTGEIRLMPCVASDLEMETLESAGFEVSFDRGSDAQIAIIRLSRSLGAERDPALLSKLKSEAWRKYHQSVLPKDSFRREYS